MRRVLLAALAVGLLGWAGLATAADAPTFKRTEDVIYGRKNGTALTMDVFTPTKSANGAAVVVVVSGGWVSSHDTISPALVGAYLDKGYTALAVVHGSQPRYAIPDALGDLHRAVRFIRTNAKEYGIDPECLPD